MRVAHIITRMIVGGAQENTLLCCQDLVRKYGDDVLLITGPSLGPEGDLLRQLAGGGVPTLLLDCLRRNIHPVRDVRAYHALKRVLREFRPEVVHTHSAKGGMLGREAAWTLRVPAIVHTVHGAPFHPYQSVFARTFFQLCERHAARRCHALVSVADAMTALMTEARVAPREKFVTIYSGMDVEPFLRADDSRRAVRAEMGFTDEQVVIGKIARLFRLKGHEDVIAAARKLVARYPQVRFLFVGDGILRQDRERQIAAAGLTSYFRFTGLVPPQRIPELIGAMDVLVHASLREGLARTLPQALIAGKPVVSYDVDGAREVVRNGETGLLVRPRDVAGLAAALEQLAVDAQLRQRLGQTGRERFTAQFRHETMTDRLRQLYERLLGRERA
jgi:glycosyltransferase involved in cell wall biosynthesis